MTSWVYTYIFPYPRKKWHTVMQVCVSLGLLEMTHGKERKNIKCYGSSQHWIQDPISAIMVGLLACLFETFGSLSLLIDTLRFSRTEKFIKYTKASLIILQVSIVHVSSLTTPQSNWRSSYWWGSSRIITYMKWPIGLLSYRVQNISLSIHRLTKRKDIASPPRPVILKKFGILHL